MSDWFSRVFLNVRAIALALLVHLLLFALIGANFNWKRDAKVAAVNPIQAVAIIEPALQQKLPEPLPEPEPEIIPEPEPIPTPEPIIPPKPVKTEFKYSCVGKSLIAKSEKEAKALQAQCEKDERKRKEAKKKADAKAKNLAEEKKKQAKRLAELERKEALLKKQEAEQKKALEKKKLEKKKLAEAKKKKRELEQKKRKAAGLKKKQLAAKKKKADAAKKAANAKRKAEATRKAKQAADERALQNRLNLEGEQRAWGQAINGTGGAAIARLVSGNYREDAQCVGLVTKWLIKASPHGQILGIRMTKSSGNALCDREAGLAIKISDPLPINVDWPSAKPEEFEFNFALQ